ncbi:sodium/calcium exchanger NCL2-like [Dendronephthya gigantea]|uniref:sodium/calcium exchanger NCL2-like n=1 Tax=Dendronephthya gigantea TaxID=151771 RepID=UPI00106D874F|nr:sodium/calcium exchanger NCL2-like isoform X2 [Dendronephthya gigantea]XP_028417781.1 sodium/calcium exchanger NCL2-like [Dendronephthya gigantea]
MAKFHLLNTLSSLAFCFLLSLNVAAEGLDNSNENATNHTDKCYEDRLTKFPCSSTIIGNLLLIVFYGALLMVAAKLISDGAELLLDLGLPAGIIGGIVLPLLGAVPDSAIIIVSGLKPNAQEQISVGMGTLAGSTIMLLTIAWGGSLFLGRCDLNSNGEAIEETGKGIKCRKQGVTLLPSVQKSSIIMLITSLLYLIVQSADWHWGPKKSPDSGDDSQPKYVKNSALATLILCAVSFVAYLLFLVYDSKTAQLRASKHRQEEIRRRVIHRFYGIANRNIFGGPRDSTDAGGEPSDPEAQRQASVGLQKKYFKTWQIGKDIKTREPTDKDPIIDKEAEDELEEAADKEENKTFVAIKCFLMLAVGVAMVTIFSDPMCDVLSGITDSANADNGGSYINISPFYVSFVVTPICSNASELVSSLLFAAKKKKENVSMTFSQLYGAATMNNTLCLGIFCALVYIKDLEWYYSAEVTVILLVQWFVFIMGFPLTYKLWKVIPVGFCYIFSIILIAILESSAVGWK